jgi:hypothetical protein
MVRYFRCEAIPFPNTMQGSLHLRAALLDSDCWPVDPLEDPTYQGRTFLGMANQAGNHRGVSVTLHQTLAYSNQPTVYPGHPCGLRLLFRISKGLQL